MPPGSTLDALARKPIFLLWLKECRSAVVALCIHALFMTFMLGPIVRWVIPKPKTYFGGLIHAGHDPYGDAIGWLDALLWPAGWALVGAYAKRRVKPTLERARRESDMLATAAGQAARAGDLGRSVMLLSRAEALAPEPGRRAQIRRIIERQEGSTIPDALASAASLAGIGPDRRIRLVGHLGRGSMGTVHLGEDTVLGRRVAVKELTGPLASHPEVRERFLREARVLAQISSPRVVQIYDIYQEGDRQFLSMELCEGEDLSARLKRSGRLPAKEAARLGAQIAEALAAAHARGVVHRDLKPANVLFSGSDIKVADFGLARLGDSSMTGSGAVMGTPDYMAPEQARGAAVDARADLYALGCVLFEMLSGGPPYRGTMQEVLFSHASPEPAPALDAAAIGAPAGLCRLVTRLLAKNPKGRPGSAAEVVEALQSHATARAAA